MASPEVQSVISYTGNLLARASGLEALRQAKAAGKTDPVDVVSRLISPALDNELNLDGSKRYLPLNLRLVVDVIGNFPPIYLLLTEHLVEAIVAKVAFNLAVAVIPDVLRAVRRNFHLGLNSTLTI